MKRILISEFMKKRPWLDLDNGELVSIIKSYRDIEVDCVYQMRSFIDIQDMIKQCDLVVLHIEHQSINYALTELSNLKTVENKLIVYGYGTAFQESLGKLKNVIKNDDIHEVIGKINEILGLDIVYNTDKLAASDFTCLPIKSIENYPIRYSKGCENNCPYCERSLEKNKIYKTPELFERELYYAKKNYGIKFVTFMDASLFGGADNQFLNEINPLLKKYNVLWRANGVTLSSLNEKYIEKIAETGCYLLSIGVEHFDNTVKVGKKVDFDKLDNILKCLKENDIFSLGFFISGLQNDTFEKSIFSLEKIRNSHFDIKLIASAVAIPGTDLWNYVNRHGRFLCEIGDTFPDKKTTVHFETNIFTAKEREKILKETDVLKIENERAKKQIINKIHGIWSTSEEGNIVWKDSQKNYSQ